MGLHSGNGRRGHGVFGLRAEHEGYQGLEALVAGAHGLVGKPLTSHCVDYGWVGPTAFGAHFFGDFVD